MIKTVIDIYNNCGSIFCIDVYKSKVVPDFE